MGDVDDELTIFLQVSEDLGCPCEADEVKRYCEGVSLGDLEAGVDEARGRRAAWLDDRKSPGSISDLDDCADMPIFDLEMDVVQNKDDNDSLLMVKSLVALMKQKLVTCIMDEFLVILKQNWVSDIQSRGTASGSTPSGAPHSESRTSSQVPLNNRGRQRNREDDDNEGPSDGDGDDDDQRAPKRPRTASSRLGTLKDSTKFACPYRKYDPRKYCVRNWRPCALTALDSVARVKFVVHTRQYQIWG